MTQLFHVPVAVIVLPQRAHQPGGLEIAGRHQHAGGSDDDGRQGPGGQHAAQDKVDQGTPLPPKFSRQGIALQNQVGCADPGAEEISPPAHQQQGQV